MMITKPMGLLDQDLAFFTDEPFATYRPKFGVERPNENVIWLTDHGRRIALVYQSDYTIDLFEFFPGRSLLANPQKPVVYHAPTQLGARLTLAQWIGPHARTSDTWDLAITENADRITLTVTETWKEPARHSVKRLELCMHPRFGYVIFTFDEVRSPGPVGIEIYNFLVKGLTHHHPSKRRFPLVVWRTPSRGLLKWTSNMVSLRCAGQRDNEYARNLGTNGWLGFFGEADWNPLFAFSESTGPCSLATCDNLLDEHLCFYPPPSAQGAYVLSCRGALLALPGPTAERVIGHATFNDLKADQPNSWWPYPVAPRLRPLCLNQLCDFETPVSLNAYYRGGYWWAIENGDDWATVSDAKAHSGRWALRLRIRREDGEKSISPVGSTLWLETGRWYRLSAYVSYEGNGPGQFRLRASQAYFTFAEQREPKEASFKATGSSEWQRLELTFAALPNDPCAFIQLFASGDGKWFVDDMLFEEVP